MPTLKQKAVAKQIIEQAESGEVKNGKELLADIGYSEAIQKNPKLILESPGVAQALADYGFNEDNAKQVVAKILLDRRTKADTRINAAKEVFKVHGSYKTDETPKPQLHIHINLSDLTPEKRKQFAITGKME